MLEHGESLLTWQLLERLDGPQSLPLPARRINDHRKAYLDYEGPVSGNRGMVQSIDRGAATIIELSDSVCRFRLDGSLLSGEFSLDRGAGSDWTLRIT